jgi:ribose transport system substrate-binding protein
MRTKRVGVAVATLAALTLAAACGDDDDDDGGAADTTSASGDTTGDTTAPTTGETTGDTTAPTSGETTGDTGGTAPAGSGDYVIGVSNTLAGNGWREEMICAVKAEALASGQSSQVIAISKNGGPSDQIQDLQNLISQGVDAIIVNPSDREQLNPVIEEAIAQGIVVVAVDQAVTAEGAYVVTNDQVEYGRLGAQWLADDLGGEGNVLYMRGIDGVPADADRHQGFTEVMEGYPDITTKEVFSGWDFTQGGDIAVQELTADTYDGIWTSGIDYTVVNAFETTGHEPVPVVGADNNEFVHQLIEGQPGALVTNPAVIGGAGTAVAIRALNGENPQQETLLTPQVWDAENNMAELEANYFEDRDPTFSSAVSIEGYTSFTPEQLFACKGPGE